MHPLTTLPKQFDVCREAQVTLVIGCVCSAQILILKIVFPFVIQYALKAVYVKKRRKTVADGTHYFAVLDGGGRVYQHTTEYLHVDTSVKHLYQAVV